MTHKKVLIPHEKSIIEARINYTSQEASNFFRTLYYFLGPKRDRIN